MSERVKFEGPIEVPVGTPFHGREGDVIGKVVEYTFHEETGRHAITVEIDRGDPELLLKLLGKMGPCSMGTSVLDDPDAGE